MANEIPENLPKFTAQKSIRNFAVWHAWIGKDFYRVANHAAMEFEIDLCERSRAAGELKFKFMIENFLTKSHSNNFRPNTSASPKKTSEISLKKRKVPNLAFFSLMSLTVWHRDEVTTAPESPIVL